MNYELCNVTQKSQKFTEILIFIFHTEITEIHRNLNLCRGKSKNLSEHQCFCDFCEFLCDKKQKEYEERNLEIGDSDTG